jgi:response regulator RpfG family c-di-GMP phosphodiesterase
VPFLTSPGSLDEKLRLVAQRLTTGAGYAGVSFALFKEEESDPADLSSFAEAPSELVERWDEANADEPEVEQPVRPILDRTQRPMIIDDVATTPFINESRRNLLLAANIHSAIVAPMVWQGKVVGTLSAGAREVGAFGPRDAQFLHAVATQVTAIVRTDSLIEELRSASNRLLHAQQETVLMLASAAEAHDHSTGRHLHRVRSIAEALALELGHDNDTAKEIGVAAVLHDIGKIRVPDYILTSTESLGDEEWTLMKQHTVWGSDFLGDRPGFALAAAVARGHHERWDGSGYPAGLVGDEIPLAAAITSVADSLDAMTNDRPYRLGRPLQDAMFEVQAWSGRQFSPQVVDALVRLYERGALPGMGEGDYDESTPDDLDRRAA